MWQQHEPSWGDDDGYYPLGGYDSRGGAPGAYAGYTPYAPLVLNNNTGYDRYDPVFQHPHPHQSPPTSPRHRGGHDGGLGGGGFYAPPVVPPPLPQPSWGVPKDLPASPRQYPMPAPPLSPSSAGPYWGAPYSEHINQIHRNVWQGGYQALQARTLQERGITCVINAAFELERGGGGPWVDWDDLQRAGIEVLHLNWEDAPRQPIYPSETLRRALEWMDSITNSGHSVLVNCAAGVSRSSSLVIAYLISRMGMTFDQALATCRAGRPQSQPNPGFESQLRRLEHETQGGYGRPWW